MRSRRGWHAPTYAEPGSFATNRLRELFTATRHATTTGHEWPE